MMSNAFLSRGFRSVGVMMANRFSACRLCLKVTRLFYVVVALPRWSRFSSVSQVFVCLVPRFASMLRLARMLMKVRPLMMDIRVSRYVLKNKDTGDVFFVVVFHLVPKEELEKENTANGETKDTKEEKMEGEEGFQPKDDDLD